MSTSLRRWQLIEDEDDRRDIVVDVDNARVCAEQVPRTSVDTWPPFTQLAIRSDALSAIDALRQITCEFDRQCQEYDPEGGVAEDSHPLWIAHHRGLILLGEPGVERDARFVTDATSERLSEILGADALHYGYDPAGMTMHLTLLRRGLPDYAWCDSRRPGPSYALSFSADGRCTRRDPRTFALDRLGLSEEVEQFDRTRFLQTQLAKFGIDVIDPELDMVERLTCIDIA
jgi:hypothetical protein